ncbi:hypothetical protein GVAV_000673 [Gurleya vavrai]
MNFRYYKIPIIVFITNIIYFVKGSDCCCLDYNYKAKPCTGIEPFFYTYMSSEFNADKIKAHFLQIYDFLVNKILRTRQWIVVTVEPKNDFIKDKVFDTYSKDDFFAVISNFLQTGSFFSSDDDSITINDIHENGYIIRFSISEDIKMAMEAKIDLALCEFAKVSNSGVKKNNILKIFQNCNCIKPVITGKFSDTHIFFIDHNIFYQKRNFLYDSILRLKALTLHKQTFPSFNISLLSGCEIHENEIKDIENKTSLEANEENSKLYEKIYEIYIISPFYIYQKQKLSESTRIDKFKKIENNVEEIKKNI